MCRYLLLYRFLFTHQAGSCKVHATATSHCEVSIVPSIPFLKSPLFKQFPFTVSLHYNYPQNVTALKILLPQFSQNTCILQMSLTPHTSPKLTCNLPHVWQICLTKRAIYKTSSSCFFPNNLIFR